MRSIILLCIVTLALSCNNTSNKSTRNSISKEANIKAQEFYIGTYTSDKSKGIYKSTLSTTGALSRPVLVANANDPSFLALTPDKKHLLAVNEIENGKIQSYETTEPKLTLNGESPSGGIHPCHISVNTQGHILTSNYSSGTVGLHQVQRDGSLSALQYTDQHQGSGTHTRQEGPHAHSAYFLGNDQVVSADLGSNELWFSKLNPDDHTLDTLYKLAMKDNAGPRHIAIHPDNETLLVVNELDCTMSLLSKTGADQKYQVINTTTTLPDTYKGDNTCADIHISRDGRYAYVSNRGHNSIAIFSIDSQYHVELIDHESTRGKTPRNFAISPDQRHVLVANQKSNNIVSFNRDDDTGALTFVDEIEAYTPVCILFE